MKNWLKEKTEKFKNDPEYIAEGKRLEEAEKLLVDTLVSGKPSELMRLLARIEACFPENPYSKSVFPMTEDEYVKEIPDPHTRTAISGFMGRFVFEATKRRFLKAIKDEFEC